jgi:hypothetical protein
MSLLYTELCCSDDLDQFRSQTKPKLRSQPPEMQFGCMHVSTDSAQLEKSTNMNPTVLVCAHPALSWVLL